MPVRTKRLAVRTSATAGAVHDAYTVPEGETCILKDVRISWLSGTVSRAAVLAASGSASVVLVDAPIPTTGPVGRELWVVLQAGDKLQVYTENGVALFWLSGTELEGVAD